jgi:hypothetical protein
MLFFPINSYPLGKHTHCDSHKLYIEMKTPSAFVRFLFLLLSFSNKNIKHQVQPSLICWDYENITFGAQKLTFGAQKLTSIAIVLYSSSGTGFCFY